MIALSKYRYLFCLVGFFFLFVNNSYSQCALSFSGPKCTGAPISFYHNSPGSSKWTWDFGGAGTSIDELPVFAFQNPGTYKVCLALENSLGKKCNSCLDIVVVKKPTIGLSQLNSSTQCFTGNSFIVKNTSIADGGGSIKRIVYTWTDGEKQEFLNPTIPFTTSKSFTNPAGGSYGLTVETEDNNGCIVIKKLDKYVKVIKRSILSINVLPNNRCDSTYLQITNNSNLLKSDLKSFKWEFDDNTSNTTDWNPGPKKWFFGNGPNDGWWGYKLIIETNSGCKDTIEELKAVRSIVFNPVIIKNKDSACANDADIQFSLINVVKRSDGTYDSSAPILGIKNFSWDFGHPIGSASGRKNSTSLTPVHSFSMGAYLVKFAYAHKVCKGNVLFDTVVIIGPHPQIEDLSKGIIIAHNHRYQCKSNDTVQFTNTSTFYHNDKNMWDDDSTFLFNGGMGHAFDANQESKDNAPQNYRYNDNVVRLWDFGDKIAPQCTTDTKAGLNVGKNCNFSRDSLPRHWYKDWEDVYRDNYYLTNTTFYKRTWFDVSRTCAIVPIDTNDAAAHRNSFWKNIPECRKVSLWLKDTVHPFRCEDKAYITIAIMPPSAKNVRFTGKYCLGESDPKYGVNFHLDDTKPGCTSNFAKVNFDVNKDSNAWLRFYDTLAGDVQTGTRPGNNPVDKPYKEYGPYGTEFSTKYELDMLANPREGCVKIGIIIGNGVDYGNNLYPACADTQYYEDAVCFPVLDSKFDIVKPKFIGWDEEKPLKVCSGEELVLRLSPSNFTKAKDVKLLAWRFSANAIGQEFDEAYDNFRYEEYHRFKEHFNYPGKLVNYIVIRDLKTPLAQVQ